MFKWLEKYNTGISNIDVQHQDLLLIANDLLDKCKRGVGKDCIEETIVFLDKYIHQHFKDEEVLHKKYNYPYLEEHKKMHILFSKELEILKEEFKKTGKTSTITIKANSMIGGWFIDHIVKEDSKFAEYMKGKL